MIEKKGKIYGVAGPTVLVKGMSGPVMNTVCLVGRQGLLGEIIRVKGDFATLQVYEDTSGISVGEEVVSFGLPLSVTLGPGLLAGIFDGIQRPLEKIRLAAGGFIPRGIKIEAIDRERLWEFTPLKKKGDPVEPGDIIGTVQETPRIVHKIMVPPGSSGDDYRDKVRHGLRQGACLHALDRQVHRPFSGVARQNPEAVQIKTSTYDPVHNRAEGL